jgi:hypothetical protein
MNSYRKKYIYITIFLFYFIVYAISPLSYSYTAKKITGNFSAADRTCCLSKDIDIFLWELACTELISRKAVSHPNSTATILLKKALIILPEDLNTKIVHSEDVSVAEDCLAPVVYPLGKLAIFFDGRGPIEEHRILHSGPSPPPV